MQVNVKTPSRIHITLIDLNAAIGRMDGGIGLALEEPSIELEAEESGAVTAEGPLGDRASDAAKKMLSGLGVDGGVSVKIKRGYPQHIGLGSGTQVALATSRAICELYDKKMSNWEMAKVVRRGGTSGIGIGAFDEGGFILDGGHSTMDKKDFLPSSASKAPPPPMLARYEFPDWRVVLVIPKSRSDIHGGREVDIFQRYCPMPLNEVREVSHIVLMKVLPSIVEGDIEGFGEGIGLIQRVGFKRIEVDLQNDAVKGLMEKCSRYAPAVGLSSFGPTIYCITEDESQLLSALEDEEVEVIVTRANNVGAVSRRV
ncbi:MAG: beta-ribofuranosylaminobenzene 5'-phosphate synthase [Candidatus Hydrothermarchaeaceae archaeon]